MIAQDKTAVGNDILGVIEREYHSYVAQVISYTIGIAEEVPAQANNEIQNALNHLAIAYTSPDLPSANKQICLAQEHLERATRDCLKICLIKRRAILDDLVSAIEDKYGTILYPERTRLKNIVKERDRILFCESRGENNISALLNKLLVECNDLYEMFLDNYRVPTSFYVKRHRVLRWFKHAIPGVFIGIVGSLIAALIYAELHLPSP